MRDLTIKEILMIPVIGAIFLALLPFALAYEVIRYAEKKKR